MENQQNLAALSDAVRKYRAGMLADPYRPTWHFTVPDDNGVPGDPNGAFFADGRYHLMYLYRNTAAKAYHWGHISSSDLLHWRHHADALTGEQGDEGCFSGGAFVDEDGCAYLTFWKFPAQDKLPQDRGGIAIAKAEPPYEHWERLEPIAIEESEWGILDLELDGKTVHLGCADPSNIWKCGNTYYMQTGNLCVLNKYGRGENADPAYQGDWTELFASEDLHAWRYLGRFYQSPHADADDPDETEDDMCPEFLPLPNAPSGGSLTEQYLQLFIAHNRGAQYYIGTMENQRFYPKRHGRFSWTDSACFAPESLIDGKNRQLAWYWFRDDPKDAFQRFGWTGVYTFPRSLWLEEDELHMAPAEELDRLQAQERALEPFSVDGRAKLPLNSGESFRIRAEIVPGDAKQIGFAVRADGAEETRIYFDRENRQLVMDTTQSGCDGWKVKECAPLTLRDGERLSLDIAVDVSTVEVYANTRQAIARRVYPTDPKKATQIFALCEGGSCRVESFKIWRIEPTNPY